MEAVFMETDDRSGGEYSVRKYDIHLLEQLNEEYRAKPTLSTFIQYDPESQFEIADKRLHRLSELVDLKEKKVLEVGCGRGYLLKSLAGQYGCSVVGIDIREHVEWQTLRYPPNLDYLVLDLSERNPFAEESFDLIVSFVAWEHMMHPFTMLKECCRILKPEGKIYMHANLYRSPRASHLYRDIYFPFPHLLFPEEVIAEFCLKHGVSKHWFDEYYYRNKLTYGQYKEYFELLNLGIEYEQLQKIELDMDFYERFKDKLEKYPRFDLELEFFNVLLVKNYRGLPERDYLKAALTRERDGRREEIEKFKAELNSARWETTRARRETTRARRETTRLRAELAKEKRTVQAIRSSLSFQLGHALVRPVRKPGCFVILLSYRLLKKSPDGLKEVIGKVTNKSKMLTSLRAFAEKTGECSVDQRKPFPETATLAPVELKGLHAVPEEPDLSEQAKLFSSFLERFKEVVLSRPIYPLVVISSTTRRIGEANRANRCMMFAQELAAAEIPVIYVYYRFKGAKDFTSYSGGYLLQMPNDLFHMWSGTIATWNHTTARLFLCSIPDVHAIQETGLFRYHGWKIVYEVRDDWEEFHKAGVGNWYDVEYERFLCQQADFVTTVSATLRDKMISLGSNPERTFLVPNGLTRNFLEKAKSSFERRRSGYRGNGTIGYFGHLTPNWLNWKLVLKTASRRPDLKFEIIGFGEPKGLNLPRNVVMLGTKNHEQIIDIASNWSVAIIPFKNTKLAEGVDPIKIYEYLALGLRCVACRMSQINDYPLTFIYHNDSKFEEALDGALKYAPSEDDWARAQAFVAASTWDQRVRMTLSLAGIDIPKAGVGT